MRWYIWALWCHFLSDQSWFDQVILFVSLTLNYTVHDQLVKLFVAETFLSVCISCHPERLLETWNDIHNLLVKKRIGLLMAALKRLSFSNFFFDSFRILVLNGLLFFNESTHLLYLLLRVRSKHLRLLVLSLVGVVLQDARSLGVSLLDGVILSVQRIGEVAWPIDDNFITWVDLL